MIQDSEGICKWSDMDLTNLNLNLNSITYPQKNYHSSPFPIDPVVNSRVSLWYGDPLQLCVDGITQTTNETIDELPPAVLSRTGTRYVSEIREQLHSIRTGEARIAPCHQNLSCRHLILTVCPKYSEQYKSASETALFSCYNSVIEKACERGIQTLAIPPLHKSSKTPFPDELGVHVAIRTIRRFLEKGYTEPALIVLPVQDPALFQLYRSLMVSYFPRESSHEDYACLRLPVEIGDNVGSPSFPDRRIRIFSNPAEGDSVDEDMGILQELNNDRDFVQMKGDIDKERLLRDGRMKRRSMSNLNENERHIAIEFETKERHERILRRARTEDLSSIEKSGCLYRSGHDVYGRQIIVMVGKWFRPEMMDLDKAFLYLVKLLDDINGPYSVVYFHAATTAENRPSFRWMRTIYDNMEYRFKKNLKSLQIVHPTLWTKVLCWWFTTFMAPAIKEKLQNVTGLAELYATVDPQQLTIPAFISELDITLNGFGGVAYSHTHSTGSNSLASTPH